jgi:hypothetical protein
VKKHTRSLIRIIDQNLICDPNDSITGVEVGVWRGANTAALLAKFLRLHMIAVDPWHLGGEHDSMPKSVQEMKDAMMEYMKVTEFAHSRLTTLPMSSEHAAFQIDNNSVDFVFLDGNHSYPSVYRDLRWMYSKVRAGGIFAGHDYGGRGDERGRFGVKRAVDEFVGGLSPIPELHVESGLVWWFRV